MNPISLSKPKKPTQNNDFSEFFLNAPSWKKKRLMVKVIREANKEQRMVMEKYLNQNT